MKILVTGASGNLGQHLIKQLSDENELLLQFHSNPNLNSSHKSVKLDLLDFNEIRKVFEEFKPECVLHTAAVSNPKLADQMPRKKVEQINVEAAKFIAELCTEQRARLIFNSTDLVYDGNYGKYLNEEAPTNPLSLYAETKLSAEEEIEKVSDNFVILRTSLMYGFSNSSGENHFAYIYNNLKNGKSVKLFTDQFRTPLALFDAAEMIKKIINNADVKNVINFGGPERLSRYDLGDILCEAAGFDKNLLTAAQMDDVDLKYKVPDVSMDISKLRSFGIEPLSIQDAMKKVMKDKIDKS